MTTGRLGRASAIAAGAVVAIAVVSALSLARLQLADRVSAESTAGAAAGCGQPDTVVDLATPDPVERQRGPAFVPPILGSGRPVSISQLSELGAQLPNLPGNEVPQLILRTDVDMDGDADSEWIIRAFYGDRAPEPNEVLAEYIDDGGWFLEERRSTGHSADQVLSELAEQGRTPLPPVVMVGPHKAVAVHSDPVIRNDLRPWHLYWSDGERDFGLRADRVPSFVIAVARSLYCPGQLVPTGD